MKKGIAMAFVSGLVLFLSLFVASAATLEQKTIGDEDAPITIEFYTTFHEPYNAQWYIETFPKIKEEYIDKGKAKFIFKHNYFHRLEFSKAASIAAECAADQEKFLEYVSILYVNQEQITQDKLSYYAEVLGVDLDEFEKCRENIETENIVDNDRREAINRGVRGSPTFFVNDKLLVSNSLSNFKKVIEEEIALNEGAYEIRIGVNDYPDRRQNERSEAVPYAYINVYKVRVDNGKYESELLETIPTGEDAFADIVVRVGEIVDFVGFIHKANAEAAKEWEFRSPPYKNFNNGKGLCQINYFEEDEILIKRYDGKESCATSMSTPYQDERTSPVDTEELSELHDRLDELEDELEETQDLLDETQAELDETNDQLDRTNRIVNQLLKYFKWLIRNR